ncbi:hypothetical protein GCM10010211_32910 [Streptomyces albospinus]|uniref:4'-phosphopantetheinyl transferase domain-containing protein n=1 Tax=Streptomyces albospinus TaxID=285515 RepID=A0ABQ2V2H7_9ACTN|nr:4'-phosphopantetheinyl transferase superfamily protein [Streptomyces albospinus]GGU65211.1 hypothetical protein GCM10010211_32910 [Streptomyces albospinus]
MAVSAVRGPEREAARGLLLKTAAGMLGASEIGKLDIGHRPGGRPHLIGAMTDTHISVSHGRGVVAVALSPAGPVGVDIEAVRPVPALALSRRYFPATESDWLGGLPAPDRAAAFLWLWTAKEAIGKARGAGLRHGGTRQRIPLPGVWPPEFAGLRPAEVPGSPGVWLSEPVRWAGCVLALAAVGQMPRAVSIRTDGST